MRCCCGCFMREQGEGLAGMQFTSVYCRSAPLCTRVSTRESSARQPSALAADSSAGSR